MDGGDGVEEREHELALSLLALIAVQLEQPAPHVVLVQQQGQVGGRAVGLLQSVPI